jgi:hypothetical protein
MKKTIELHKRWKDDPSKGEVFTPEELVCEMLDKIPEFVWKNPTTTFLDPCMGKGTFLIEIVRRLINIYGYSKEDAISRVYGYDIRVKYINYLKRGGFINVFHKDFLNDNIDMKFDCVIGNPPFTVGKNNPLWYKFVMKSFDLCKSDGYVSLIHPNGWRNVDGRFKETQEIIKSKTCLHLEMYDVNKGYETFKVNTPFDWYVVKNSSSNKTYTKVKFQDGEVKDIDIKNMEFIPNFGIEEVSKLIAKKDEDTVEILHSESMYEVRKPHMSSEYSEEFNLPCVYSVLKDGTFSLKYSNTDKGYFGIQKLILGNGANPTCFIDYNGEYAMTQFSFAIVDSIDNLEKIKKVLESEKFSNITKSVKYVATAGNPLIYPKIAKLLRKDFWKEFIDE